MLARRAAAVPQAGAGPVRLRDRRGRHAAGPGRRRTTPRSSPVGPDPQHARSCSTAAALIMSVFLITSSLVTTWLIPAEEFEDGRQGQRPRAGLPGPRLPRRRVRHGLRHLARSRSCGSPAPRRWPACSTSSRATCPATAWRPSGPRAVRPLVLICTAIAFAVTIDLPGRRRRAGRRLRHRRAGAHDLGRRRRHAGRAQAPVSAD